MKKKHLLLLALLCYLGLYNGHLALYQEKCSTPLLVLPQRQEVYSPQVQRALQKGIPYSSTEELARILEDFLS